MSGLGLLLLVLQNSNSFDLNAFFQVLLSLLSLLLTFYEDLNKLTRSGSLYSIGFFERSRIMFLFFFSSEIFRHFSVKFHIFESFFIIVHLFVVMGLYFVPARGCPASVSDHVTTSKDYIKVDHVRT